MLLRHNDFDFHETAHRKLMHGHAGTRGERAVEELAVHFVDGREIGNVHKIDGGLHDIGRSGADGVKQGPDVLEGLFRLCRNPAFGELARGGIDAELTGEKVMPSVLIP